MNRSVSNWDGSPRRAVGAAKREGGAIHLKGSGSRFQDPDQLQVPDDHLLAAGEFVSMHSTK